MSIKYAYKQSSFYDIFSSFVLIIIIIFTSVPCGALNSSVQKNIISSEFKKKNFHAFLKRDSSGRGCLNNSECEAEMHGSVCIESKCLCPQGPTEKGIGCLRFGNAVGNYCNVSSQCGIGLDCRNHVCLCHEGLQLFQSHGINMCLLWHKPTKIMKLCRLNEDCIQEDVNTVCKKKKRWCQCNNGYQMFETILFGKKHKCFKTFQFKCHNSSQCSKFLETPYQYCMCYYGVCHCVTDINSTSPDWCKKDIILANRILYITGILFFGSYFIYVVLGMRTRLFSQIVQQQPSRSPAVHYSQRRSSNLRSSPVKTAHHVEHPNGINSRLVENRSTSHPQDSSVDLTDPPPSYDEIMRR